MDLGLLAGGVLVSRSHVMGGGWSDIFVVLFT